MKSSTDKKTKDKGRDDSFEPIDLPSLPQTDDQFSDAGFKKSPPKDKRK